MAGSCAERRLASARSDWRVTALALSFLIAQILLLSEAFLLNGRTFGADDALQDKALSGDAVVTLGDVTAVRCALRCLRRLGCAFFVYSSAARACAFAPISASFTSCPNTALIDAPGYRLFRNNEARSDDIQVCPSGTVTPRGCWRLMDDALGDFRHVSVGPAGVWASRGSGGQLYHRTGSYQTPDASATTGWTTTGGGLTQLDVGSDVVWGNYVIKVYARKDVTGSLPEGSAWIQEGRGFRWVSVSPGGSVWTFNSSAGLLLHGPNGGSPAAWDAVDTDGADLQRVDAGRAGVWALDNAGRLHYRLGTYGQDGVSGTGWQQVGASAFSSVSSGRDLVVAVDDGGHVWLRTCMGADTTLTSLGWVWLTGGMTQAEIYQSGDVTAVWAVGGDGKVYFYLLG